MLKKILNWLVRFVAAGMLVIVIFCAVSLLYYNTGRHYGSPTGATDYLWEGNTFYCQMREGFGFGVTDSDGFNNAHQNASKDSEILIIGSSHMEAANVRQSQTTAYMLNEYLSQASIPLSAYNIGASSHDYYRCASNFEFALKTYSPEIIIIETYIMPLNELLSLSVLEGKFGDISSYDDLLYDIQAVPLPKLMMQQVREYQSANAPSAGGFARIRNLPAMFATRRTEQLASEQNTAVSYDNCNALTAHLGQLAKEYGAQLIIFYHPMLSLQRDGSARAVTPQGASDIFGQMCIDNGIIYLDMGEVFLENYRQNHTLPHGFVNSEPAEGHLNRYGHQMIAQELFEIIAELRGR